MSIKKMVGFCIIASFFIGIFILIAIPTSFLVAGGIFAGAVIFSAILSYGVYLMHDGS